MKKANFYSIAPPHRRGREDWVSSRGGKTGRPQAERQKSKVSGERSDGGAMLEFLSGEELPGITILK